jgi:predicted SnoaL-like aldol condensation-catalyzing enzyme
VTADTERNKPIVAEVTCNVFNKRNCAMLERHFAPQHIQQKPLIPGSRNALRRYVEKLSPDRHWEAGMALAQSDLVMIRGRYAGSLTKALVAVDILRFEYDCVVAHRGVLREQAAVEKAVTGTPMFAKHVK